jgi:hypothetical protein
METEKDARCSLCAWETKWTGVTQKCIFCGTLLTPKAYRRKRFAPLTGYISEAHQGNDSRAGASQEIVSNNIFVPRPNELKWPHINKIVKVDLVYLPDESETETQT